MRGFAGMYMLHRLRGMGFTARVLEAGSGVGGTWYWNRYPGARCDVESVQYSYQFDDALQQEWEWSERYAAQPEILRYANHVADRFDLRRDIQFNTRVTSARVRRGAGRWSIETGDGARTLGQVSASWRRAASPRPTCRSSKGSTRFEGATTTRARGRTSRWISRASGVAIIGTGSSAVQSIPIIAGQAKQLTVFQRTPNYAVPAHNAPLDPAVCEGDQGRLSGHAGRAPSRP